MKTAGIIMREAFLEELCKRMHKDKTIFFVCADFGSPKLDYLRKNFRSRFLNVGIAEQNLINISSGLALEGFNVYAYAIAPFLTMRAYEQIRTDLSLYAQLRQLNVNLIGVGAGLSYDVSGPTHHCLEDISIMRTLPNIMIFSPSDGIITKSFVDYSLRVKMPKYIRLDGKALPNLYDKIRKDDIARGFSVLKTGKRICLIATGYMTHKALKIASMLNYKNTKVGVIDFFMLRPFNNDLLSRALNNYKYIITLEEGFIGKGGLDSLVLSILDTNKNNLKVKSFGFDDKYVFDIGDREYLHKINGLDEASIIKKILKL